MRFLALLALSACPRGEDTDSDDSDTDTGVPTDPWEGCPTADGYAGDAAWTDEIVVGDEILCASPGEGQPLADVKAAKARARFAPGTYGFPPASDGSGTLHLPACVEVDRGESPAAATTGGTFEVEITEDDGYGYRLGAFTASFALEGGGTLDLSMNAESEADLPWPPVNLDATWDGNPSSWGGSRAGVRLGDASLVPCAGRDDWLDASLGATFDGGTAELTYKAIPGSVSTGPSARLHVTGTLDGTSFDVDDYYRILYSPAHHHFGGTFAVEFDAPISEACGLVVEVQSEDAATVSLVDCGLGALGTRAVSDAHVW